MKVYIKILNFINDQAHGCFCLGEHGETLIPFSMPVSAYQIAEENGLLIFDERYSLADAPQIESPVLHTYQKIQ